MTAVRLRRFRAVFTMAATAGISSVLALALALALSTTAAAAGGASPEVQAKQSLVVRTDLPKGWMPAVSSDGGGAYGDEVFPGAAALAGCLGLPANAIAADPPTVRSHTFDNSDQSSSVEDSISILPSVQAAQAEVAALADARTPACLAAMLNGTEKAQMQAEIGGGATVGTTSVTRPPSGTYGKGATALTLVIPVKDQSQAIVTRTTLVFFSKGNLGEQLSLSTLTPSFPPVLARHLASVAIGRL